MLRQHPTALFWHRSHRAHNKMATPSNPSHPGCFPFVPTRTSSEAASIDHIVVFLINTWRVYSDEGNDSRNRIAPRPHPKIVTTCQVAHRILTWRSPRMEPPWVGINPLGRILRKIRNSPNTECISPTMNVSPPAAMRYEFIDGSKLPDRMFRLTPGITCRAHNADAAKSCG